MKYILQKIFYIILIILGIFIGIWSVYAIVGLEFEMVGKYSPKSKDQNLAIISGLISVCLIGYGFFQLLIISPESK